MLLLLLLLLLLLFEIIDAVSVFLHTMVLGKSTFMSVWYGFYMHVSIYFTCALSDIYVTIIITIVNTRFPKVIFEFQTFQRSLSKKTTKKTTI